MAFDYNQHAGAGTENLSPQASAPFMSVIQKGSPEIDPTHPKHKERAMPTAKAGDIIFNPERRILPQPLRAIPVGTLQCYQIFRPRNQGGGWIKNMDVMSAQKTPGYVKHPKGHPKEYKEFIGQDEAIYTVFVFILWLDKTEWKKGILTYTGATLKTFRQFSSQAQGFRLESNPDIVPPIFARECELKTEVDSNPKGGWMVAKLVPSRVLDPEKDESLLTMAAETSKDAAIRITASEQKQLASPATEQPY